MARWEMHRRLESQQMHEPPIMTNYTKKIPWWPSDRTFPKDCT